MNSIHAIQGTAQSSGWMFRIMTDPLHWVNFVFSSFFWIPWSAVTEEQISQAASPDWSKLLSCIVSRWFTAAPTTPGPRQRPGLSGRSLPPMERMSFKSPLILSPLPSLSAFISGRRLLLAPFYDAGRATRLFALRHVTGMEFFFFFFPVRAERSSDTATARGECEHTVTAELPVK